MIKYTPAFVDKLENILSESAYMVRYERGNFQSGWCLLDHKRIVVLNRFLNTEGRVNTLVDLIPQLKIDYDKLTLNSQKIYDFLAKNHIPRATQVLIPKEDGNEPADTEVPLTEEEGEEQEGESGAISEPDLEGGAHLENENKPALVKEEGEEEEATDAKAASDSPADPDQDEPAAPSGY